MYLLNLHNEVQVIVCVTLCVMLIRLGWWKVTFCERFHRDVYVPIKSDHRHALSVVARQPAVTKVTSQHRQNPTPTQHLLVRGRLLVADATPSVISVCRRQVATRATLWHLERCPLADVLVCRKRNQCRTSDRRDSRQNVYCMILTVAVTMSRSQSQRSVSYAAARIIVDMSPWPCCLWISVGFCCNVVWRSAITQM